MNNTSLSIIFLAPVYGIVSYLFSFLIFRFDRLILVSKFSPGIAPFVWICSAFSFGFVRMRIFQSRCEVSYNLVSFSSGNSSSSSSSSSSSMSVSVAFRFWSIFNFPFNMSRSISSQRPYLPSHPVSNVCSSGEFQGSSGLR